MRRISRFLLALMLAAPAAAAEAQTAPSAAEIAGYRGLLDAAQRGDAAEIARLVADGADPETRDRRGRTAVHVAAYAGQAQALRALAQAGADMNALEGQAYDAVTIAAVMDRPGLMSLAIELGNDPGLVTSPYDGTALIAAAHLGHGEVVRRLIEAGAPLDHVNNLGWTALIEAVVLGDGGADHQEVVRLLVAAGADRSLGDRDGVTPLEHAEARGFSAIAALLSQQQ